MDEVKRMDLEMGVERKSKGGGERFLGRSSVPRELRKVFAGIPESTIWKLLFLLK